MCEGGVFIVLTVCLVMGLIVSKYNITAPSVLTPLIWIGMLTMTHLIPHTLPPLTSNFYDSITIWVVTFCFASMLMQSLKYKPTVGEASKTAVNVYFIISVLSAPILIIFAISAILLVDPNLPILMRMRYAAVGAVPEYGFGKPFSTIFMVFWQISYYFELYYYDSTRKSRLIIAIAIYMLFAFVIMAKAVLLQFFIVSCAILLTKGAIKLKHILYGAGVLAVIFIIFQFFRQSGTTSNYNVNKLMTLYIIGHMYAFDTLTPCTAVHWGENTFRFIYAITYKLHLSGIEPISTLLPFIEEDPLETNTYTTLYPFFIDFGNKGIAIFGAVLGALYGYIFKKQSYKSPLMVMIYAYCVYLIIMQFIAEQTFTNFSLHLKFIILFCIPFMFPTTKSCQQP